jgi:hypothetical protein
MAKMSQLKQPKDPVDRVLDFVAKVGADMSAARYVKFLDAVVAALQEELETDEEEDDEEDEDEPEEELPGD